MDTVLIVDDERVIRNGCKRAFDAEGFRVLTAANGREALEVLSSTRVDVMLCDLKMPVMGAVDVMKEVSSLYPDLPIIIITGQGTVGNAIESIKAGAYDFVTKPFRIEDLVALVKRAKDGLPPPPRFPGGKLSF